MTLTNLSGVHKLDRVNELTKQLQTLAWIWVQAFIT
jgi:hypothetical protein